MTDADLSAAFDDARTVEDLDRAQALQQESRRRAVRQDPEAAGKRPQWVRCGVCGHEWIGLYMPVEVSRLSKIVRGMSCPDCSAGSMSIYLTTEGGANASA